MNKVTNSTDSLVRFQQQEIKARERFAQFSEAIDQILIEQTPKTIGTLGKNVITLGGTAGGAAIGWYSMAIFAEATSWLGLGIGAVIGCYFANRYVKNYNERAEEVRESMENLVEKTKAMVKKFSKDPHISEKTAKAHAKYLINSGYVDECSDKAFSFNKEKFLKIEKHYPDDVKKDIVNGVKFIILSSVYVFPIKLRPTDNIIRRLASIVEDVKDRALVNFGRLALGRLYFGKQNDEEGIRQLKKIDKKSVLFEQAQGLISLVEGHMKNKVRQEKQRLQFKIQKNQVKKRLPEQQIEEKPAKRQKK
jgi:hypothetical protein